MSLWGPSLPGPPQSIRAKKGGEKQRSLYLQDSHIHELRGRDRCAPDGFLEQKEVNSRPQEPISD